MIIRINEIEKKNKITYYDVYNNIYCWFNYSSYSYS